LFRRKWLPFIPALTGKPLIERKRVLRSLLAPVATSPILFADYFDGRGIELYREVCRMDLEGIVAKRKDGLYTPEETSWVKIRNPKYSQMEGRRELFEKRAVAVA
jgi:ATP-dependent DNA ligase